MTVDVAGEAVDLLPAKAAFWPRAGTLFVADPHWGKADAFRAAGVPVAVDPAGELDRLAAVIAATRADRLVILGDLFHAKAGKSPQLLAAVAAWRAAHRGLDVLLVRGNHDRHAGDPPPDWHFRCEPEPVPLGPFALRHFPHPTPDAYTLAGHLHPAVALSGRGRQRLVLPCFHLTPAVGVLPAFGRFTGTATITPSVGDRVFAVAGDEVVAVG